jgi:steroid delta-isomerase-like uncharacterized protein
MADTNENLMVARRFIETVWNRADPSYIGDLVSEDYVAHDADFQSDDVSGDFLGPDGAKDNVAFYKLAFPDLQLRVDDSFGQADRVVLRWTASGTHAGGNFMGVEPFGENVRFGGITVYRFDADGRIAEEWTQVDMYRLMNQLGAIREPEPEEEEIPIGQPASDRPFP